MINNCICKVDERKMCNYLKSSKKYFTKKFKSENKYKKVTIEKII